MSSQVILVMGPRDNKEARVLTVGGKGMEGSGIGAGSQARGFAIAREAGDRNRERGFG